jgi:hypothetical protein
MIAGVSIPARVVRAEAARDRARHPGRSWWRAPVGSESTDDPAVARGRPHLAARPGVRAFRRGCLYNPPSSGKAVRVIDERQQAMLEFERTFWTFDEPKEMLVRARFQCSADEYYAELNELLELPGALEHDPLVVRRLQRQRVRRRRERLDTGTDAQGGSPT